MIDAASFATYHNAFWAEYTPTSEHFLRRLNLEYVKRWSLPLGKPKEPIRAAFVAELAFSRFCAGIDGVPKGEIDKLALAETGKRLRPLLEDPATLEGPLTSVEEKQISELEGTLRSFFTWRATCSVARPLFRGCGYIDTSEGDVLRESCLFEVKTVDRAFRSIDIRQLTTYCALNHASRQYKIDSIGVFNPRRGLYFEYLINDVPREISGRSAQELFDDIVHVISSSGISR